MQKKLRVFCDFDGTITKSDLGDELFKQFGEFEPYNSQLKNREITIKEYWHKLCDTIPRETTFDVLNKFALEAEVDDYFLAFIGLLNKNEIKVDIVSDGFDVYIKPVLKKLGLDYLPVVCNELDKNEDGFYPIFPNAAESCNCFSAGCKRNYLLTKSGDDEIVIYIGDGYSDFCPAEHSDIVFAKKNLAAYCNENKIPHYPWKSFFDIKRIFAEQILAGKAKHRNVAKVKRKRAFEAE